MFAFTKNTASVNAMEDDVEIVGLDGEATIVIKDIWAFSIVCAFNNADRLGRRIKSRWGLATISR